MGNRLPLINRSRRMERSPALSSSIGELRDRTFENQRIAPLG
jgi:hypothetical protein